MGEGEGVSIKISESEKVAEESWCAQAIRAFKEEAYDAVPDIGGLSDEDLKNKGVLLPLACVYFIVFTFCLLFFSIWGAITIVNNRFLVVDVGDGLVCDTVKTYITANYIGDLSGRWSTDKDFNQNTTMFSLSFAGGMMDNSIYIENMGRFRSSLYALGAKAAKRDTLYSLLALATYNFQATDASRMSFYASIWPDQIVSALGIWSFAIVDRHGRCDLSSSKTLLSAGYDAATKKLNLHFQVLNVTDAAAGIYKEPCPDQIISLNKLLGYKADKYGTAFTFGWDVRSIFTALAVNMGLLRKSSLMVTSPGSDPTLNNFPSGEFYLDPGNFESMDPIFCLSDEAKGGASNPDVCFLWKLGVSSTSNVYGDILEASLFYPLATSFGDFAAPSVSLGPCRCPRDANLPSCSLADYMLTLFYDKGSSNNGVAKNSNVVNIGLKFQKFLIDDPVDGDIAQSFAAYPFGLDSTALFYANTYQSTAVTADFDALCPDGSCGMLMFELSEKSIFQPVNAPQLSFYALSDQYVVDSTGNPTTQKRTTCNDVISFPAAFEKLAANPPVELAMPFFSCHNTLTQAFMSSIGVAQGYAILLTGVTMGILGVALTCYLNQKAKRAGLEPQIVSKKKKLKKREADMERLFRGLVQNLRALEPLVDAISTSAAVGDNAAVQERFAAYHYNKQALKPTTPEFEPPELETPPADFVPLCRDGAQGGDSDAEGFEEEEEEDVEISETDSVIFNVNVKNSGAIGFSDGLLGFPKNETFCSPKSEQFCWSPSVGAGNKPAL